MRARLIRRGILMAAFTAAFPGCVLQSPPATDELQKDALPHTALPEAWKTAGAEAAPVADRWLASFNDPALSALVDEALAYNADLQIAAARVEQAAGYVNVARASLLPWVGAAGRVGDKSGTGGGLEGVFLSASLELDVWGRVRYGRAAAQAQSEATAADFAYARQSLAATVAKSWFAAIEAGLLTPPFGLLVYTVKAAMQDEEPGVSLVDIFWSSTPYWIVILLAMTLIVAFPGIATWLPGLMF